MIVSDISQTSIYKNTTRYCIILFSRNTLTTHINGAQLSSHSCKSMFSLGSARAMQAYAWETSGTSTYSGLSRAIAMAMVSCLILRLQWRRLRDTLFPTIPKAMAIALFCIDTATEWEFAETHIRDSFDEPVYPKEEAMANNGNGHCENGRSGRIAIRNSEIFYQMPSFYSLQIRESSFIIAHTSHRVFH